MALKVHALEQNNPHEFDGFYAIYSIAFPLSEQKSRDALLQMVHSSFYTIYLAYNDEKIVGFCMMYHPLNEDFFLLEYMAIDETQRGIVWICVNYETWKFRAIFFKTAII